VPLDSGTASGRNILTIEGRKSNNITGSGWHRRVEDFETHRPTEVETVYITGDFCVEGSPQSGFSIAKKRKVSCARDITCQGYPFYAGKAEFIIDVDHSGTNKKTYFRIDDVSAASIRIYVNGKYAVTGYLTPFLFDITAYLKEGKNEIKVTAATTLFNLMGPNWICDISERIFVGPDTFTAFDRFDSGLKLLPFGIGNCILTQEVSDNHLI
jgi:hypothetical protein